MEKLGFKYYCDMKNIDYSGKEIREITIFLEKK